MKVFRGILLLSLMMLGVAVFGVVGVLIWSHFESLETIQGRIESVSSSLSVLRVVVMVSTVVFWGRITTWVTSDRTQQETLLAARWRVAVWLVILELTLGQGLLQHFVESF